MAGRNFQAPKALLRGTMLANFAFASGYESVYKRAINREVAASGLKRLHKREQHGTELDTEQLETQANPAGTGIP
jgi:hypothetical protein